MHDHTSMTLHFHRSGTHGIRLVSDDIQGLELESEDTRVLAEELGRILLRHAVRRLTPPPEE